MASKASANGSRNGGGSAADTLRDAGQELLGLLMQRAASAATDRIAGFSDRLTDVAEGGEGLRSLVQRRPRDDEDDGGGDDSDEGGKGGGIGSVLGGLKDKVQGALGGSKGDQGGKKKLKLTNIVETLDVGLPLRTTYDLWTRFTDFPTFMKKVESVTQPEDEITQWKAQVFFSHREWEATIVEQVPDSHIVWRSKGAKGRVDGAVTFTAVGQNLTRVALVMEYHPQGLFERTGNLWRAQGRRARLEFKHFRRHAMTQALLHPEEIEGWRGEIRDGEVVKTHEEALEEEGSGRQKRDYSDMDEVDASEAEELEKEGWQIEPLDENEDEEEDYADEAPPSDEDEPEDSDEDEERPEEDEDYPEDEYDEEEPDEDEDEPYDDEDLDNEDLDDEDLDDEDLDDEDLDDEDLDDEAYDDEAFDDEPYELEDDRASRRRNGQPVGAGSGRRGART